MVRALGDDVVGVALEEGDDVGDGAFVEELYALGGLVGEVGCKDYLIAGEDGVAGGDWLLGEDIEAGAGEVSRLEGFHEGGVVDQARRVRR